MREFLEKHYTEEVAGTEKESVKLALKALLEVVQSGSKNMEIAIMRRNEPLKVKKKKKNLVVKTHQADFWAERDCKPCGVMYMSLWLSLLSRSQGRR